MSNKLKAFRDAVLTSGVFAAIIYGVCVLADLLINLDEVFGYLLLIATLAAWPTTLMYCDRLNYYETMSEPVEYNTAKRELITHDCFNCKHGSSSANSYPCCSCVESEDGNLDQWEPNL